MPQIAQLAETWSSQIFWLLVFFGITFFFIGRLMVPRVMETVALRDKQIGDDLAAAQAAPRAQTLGNKTAIINANGIPEAKTQMARGVG